MRALVAGGAGFLGSHLCDRLVEQGHEVLVVDNLQTGRLSNLSHFGGNRRIEFRHGDVINKIDGKFDRIYNLACPGSPPRYQQNPIGTARTNFIGVDNLLQLAAKCGARFFQASTSEVYGDPLIHPQPEHYQGNVNPIGPRACYDEGKRIGETLCFDYHRQYNVKIKVARIFNTYGPRMNADDGRVVSNFIVQALSNKPIEIYGNGEQTRSFCYVSDLIDGFVRLMESPEEVLGPVNLGNPGEYTIGEFARIIIEMTASRSKIVYCELPKDDPWRRRPDIGQAKKVLCWQPTIDLREGLLRTITYFEEQLRLDRVG
ncbi:MAG: UDP-glucuronic acid decarboxylase family protein [Aestuariivirga sp.]